MQGLGLGGIVWRVDKTMAESRKFLEVGFRVDGSACTV